jgi:hypothetical protein
MLLYKLHAAWKKRERDGNGKNFIFYLKNALSFSFYLCKSIKKHIVLLFVKHKQSVLVETNILDV